MVILEQYINAEIILINKFMRLSVLNYKVAVNLGIVLKVLMKHKHLLIWLLEEDAKIL